MNGLTTLKWKYGRGITAMRPGIKFNFSCDLLGIKISGRVRMGAECVWLAVKNISRRRNFSITLLKLSFFLQPAAEFLQQASLYSLSFLTARTESWVPPNVYSDNNMYYERRNACKGATQRLWIFPLYFSTLPGIELFYWWQAHRHTWALQ